jgi:N-acetylglucosaminyl-diphospho-decaprenol L-rhamnosyltransferase
LKLGSVKLLVVIVCYKVVDLTIACLRSLEAEVAAMEGTKVAVCENGTGGDSVARLEKAIAENGWSSWVELTSVTPNRGFTGGNNHVIRPAFEKEDKPEYVLLLNADTELHAGAFRELVEFMDSHPRAGIAGSQLLSRDGRVQGSPFKFDGIANQLDKGMRLGIVTRLLGRWVDPPTQAEANSVDWVAGASMIIRREVIEQIGALDDGYYTYFDDIDYCLNAKRAGWEVWYVPASRVMHLEGESTGIKYSAAQSAPKRKPPYWFHARRRYFLKNYGAFYTACIDAANIFGQATWRLRRIIQRKADPFPASLFIDSIRNSVFLTGFKLRDVENPAMKKVPVESQPANRMNHATE